MEIGLNVDCARIPPIKASRGTARLLLLASVGEEARRRPRATESRTHTRMVSALVFLTDACWEIGTTLILSTVRSRRKETGIRDLRRDLLSFGMRKKL